MTDEPKKSTSLISLRGGNHVTIPELQEQIDEINRKIRDLAKAITRLDHRTIGMVRLGG